MELFSSTETGLLCFERVVPGSSERMNDSTAGNESLLDIHSSSSSTSSVDTRVGSSGHKTPNDDDVGSS